MKLAALAFAVEEGARHFVGAEEEGPFEGAAAVGLFAALDVDAEPEAVEAFGGAAELLDASPLVVGGGDCGDGYAEFLFAVAVGADADGAGEVVALGDFAGEAEGFGLVHRSLS